MLFCGSPRLIMTLFLEMRPLENVKQLSSQAFEYERKTAMLLLNRYP